MGKLPNGIFGALVGTTGNLTGYVLNGQNILKMIPHPNPHRSIKQKANSQKMTVINEFFYYLGPLLKAGYSIAAKGTTKNYYNLAVSYNKKYAVKGEYPDIEMDYPNVMFSEGKLLPAINPVAELVPEGVKFSWDQADGSVNQRNFDQVMVMAYGTVSKQVRYIRYGAERHIGFEVLHIIDNMINEPLETYISFVDDERTMIANSIYTGRLDG